MTDPLKLKIIACGVFEDELRAVAARSTNNVDVELLDAGLHAAPDQLRLRAQEAIDAASRAGGYDGIGFAYGLCGRGTAGLIARDAPLVLPRVHDCISLFLGSAQAYYQQFAAHPGTFYFTTGWYKNKAHPEHTRMAAARRFDPATHSHYPEFCEKYGEENARYIIEFFESWRKNYRRAALIDHGFATPEHEETTRLLADAAGWDYEKLQGSLALLEDLAAGRWDEERFLVVQPGHMVVPTNDERIYAAVPAGQDGTGYAGLDAAARVEVGTFVYGDRSTSLVAADLGLGIDAGGTYTDAVLYEFATGRLVSKAKAITTHHNLVEGIAEAVDGLDAGLFGRVSYAALSTTLATNAIVEGRGQPVGLLLMPFHENGAAAVRTELFRTLSARMTVHGHRREWGGRGGGAAGRAAVGQGGRGVLRRQRLRLGAQPGARAGGQAHPGRGVRPAGRLRARAVRAAELRRARPHGRAERAPDAPDPAPDGIRGGGAGGRRHPGPRLRRARGRLHHAQRGRPRAGGRDGAERPGRQRRRRAPADGLPGRARH